MGLLDKTNPRATAKSVVRRAVVAAVAGAAFFFLAFKPDCRRHWPVVLPVWTLLCAGVGALVEWQVADPDDEVEEPPRRD